MKRGMNLYPPPKKKKLYKKKITYKIVIMLSVSQRRTHGF
jgi:hypothetical protein